jgi:N-acetylglucosamine-6-phosphate deacetylase
LWGVPSLTAARVVTPHGVLAPGTVDIEGGRISAVRQGGTAVGHRTLVPGFVDLQVNGIGDIDVATADGDDWAALDQRLLAQGVTAWCPTLVTMPLQEYATPLTRIAGAAMRDGKAPAILGAHLEGPFLGGAPGAHRRELVVPLDREWLGGLPEVVRLVTLAPELDGAAEAVRLLVRRGVVVSLGHSTATYDETLAAVAAGARLVTHCFNGMGRLDHRAPGLVGAALTDKRLTVSLIADLVHVHPAALALAFRAKGAGRVALVTDAVGWEAADLPVDGGAPRLDDGTLAGSCLTMDAAGANVVASAGVALADAVDAAATAPADLLGEPDRGRLAAACRADLVALDGDLRAVSTWVGGEQVWAR